MWTNWSGAVTARPERHYYPSTLDDLVRIIRHAEAQRSRRRVRVVGSGWSFTDLAASDDYLVETCRLNRTLAGPVQSDTATGIRTYYHVEAGIRLSDLSRRLADHRSAGAGAAGWTLPTLPGASGQTLAGAISTGTHGADSRNPPLSDEVHAIHLVTSGGDQIWVQAGTGIIPAATLHQKYPGIQVHDDPMLLRAAQVALGRFGVIYAVVVRVVPQYGLREARRSAAWSRIRADLQGGDLIRAAQSVQVVIDPYPQADGDHRCYVTTRDRSETLPRHRSQRLSGALATLPRLTGWRPGDTLALLCNQANRRGRADLTRRMVSFALTLAQRPATVTGIHHELLTRQAWIDEWCRGYSLEIFFDASSPRYLDIITRELLPHLASCARRGIAIAGWVSLRFTGSSRSLLAMQRWNPTVGIEITTLRGIRGADSVLRGIERIAVRHGGTVHWGQQHSLTATEIQDLFPELTRWRIELAKLTPAGQDTPTFSNRFTDALGLKP